MKHKLFFAILFVSFSTFAGVGPTNLGSVSIGMSKTKYISNLGIDPVNCNTYKGRGGKLQRSEMKYLSSDKMTLCWGFGFDDTGSIENIQVSGLSYDVIEARSKASKFVKSVGFDSKAIFLKDKLISIEISFPEVSLDTLEAKYGEPELVDRREIEVCTNKMGNKFKNNVGKLDAVWVNGKVRSILRADTSPPRKTCTDGITMRYYIIEEPKQLKIISDAINKYKKSIAKEAVKDSPF